MAERLRIPIHASFTPAHRLHHKPEFDLLYKEGRRIGDRFFALVTRPNTRPHARLGLSISAKSVGNAVNRNRVKRVLRDSFRLHLGELPAIDIVVNARAPAKLATNLQLRHSIEQLWAKLARHA